ncbi:MAG: hypothetical protein R2754_05425 [Microthrixaceae bacterium]
MSRRLDIEITSLPDDDRFTWRVTGAKQPKGEGRRGLLPEGTKVGDELKVDADFTLDGIEILGVSASKRQRKEPERLELITSEPTQLVTTKLAPKGRGRGGRRDERGGRGRDRDERGRGRGRDGRGGRGDRPGGDERGGRRDGDERGRGRGRGDRPHRPAPPEVPTRPKPKRLKAGKAHRNAALAALPDEQRPVADQLVAGGLPAVRSAIDEQNKTNKAEGRPEVKPGPLIGLAEQLQEQLRVAEWLDRAEAALAQVDEVDLRDLRSVVVAGDTAATDETARALATQLREALNTRVETEQTAWAEEIEALINAGRVIRALRVSSRSPKAGAPVPAELANRLADAVVESVDDAMTDDRWGALLDALAFSPVRGLVHFEKVPSEPSKELVNAVTAVASRLPELARQFGVDPATAPKQPPRRRPGGDKRRSGPKGGSGGKGGKGGGEPGRRGDRPPRGSGGGKSDAAPKGGGEEATARVAEEGPKGGGEGTDQSVSDAGTDVSAQEAAQDTPEPAPEPGVEASAAGPGASGEPATEGGPDGSGEATVPEE